MRLDLIRLFNRWRHGRGFGIHSPFAFRFITATLREQLPYYAYDRLDALCGSIDTTFDSRRIRLLFRILVHFNPSNVSIIGSPNAAIERIAVKAFDPSTIITGIGSPFVIVNDDSGRMAAWPDATGRLVAIFPDQRVGGKATCKAVWDSVKHGMRFDNHREFTVIIADPRLPRQQFEVRF